MRFPQDYLQVLRKRRGLAIWIFGTVLAVTAGLILFLPREYEAQSTVLLDSGLNLSAQGAILSDLVGASSGPSPETQLEVILARPNLERTIRELKLGMRPEDLEKKVHAMHPKQTEIVKVFAAGPTPEKAAEITNSLVQGYMLDTERRQEMEADSTAGDVHRRLLEIEGQLKAKEAEMVGWLERNKLGLPEEEMKLLVTRLGAAEDELHETQVEAAAGRMEADRLRAEFAKEAPTIRFSTAYGTSPVVDKLRQDLNELNVERAKRQYEYKTDQPEVKEVDEQIAETEKRLATALAGAIKGEMYEQQVMDQANPVQLALIQKVAETDATLVANMAKLAELKRIVPKLERQVSILPAQTQQFGTLQRERESLATVWAGLTQKYEELKVQEYATIIRPVVIEPASPPLRLSQPRPVLYSVIGLLMACILSLTACVAVESADRRVRVAKDAPELLGIPSMGSYSRALPEPEADRLFGRLALAGAGTEWRVLAVVSSQSGARETTKALASAAVRQGHSVVVIQPNQSMQTESPGMRIVPAPEIRGMSEAVQSYRTTGSLVMIDLPSPSEFPAAYAAVRLADRVMLDLQQGTDSAEIVEGLLEGMTASNINVIGAAIFIGHGSGVAA